MARLGELEEIELKIEKIVSGGDGFARFEGIPFFVPRGVPGDHLRVRLFERKGDYARAEIVEILTPSKDRREPPCRHFDRCGGCDLQHIEDARQVEWKAAATIETLRRLGRLELRPSQVQIVSGDAWGYRMRTQLHTTPALHDEGVERDDRETAPLVGYFGRGSHDLVPVEACPVLVPELEREVVTLGRRLPVDAPRRIDLALGDHDALSVSPVVGDLPHGEIEATVGDFRYAFDSRCFFQGHRQLLPQLVEHVVGEERGEEAIDLYCGVGLFSLPLAERYSAVTAVESDRLAMRYAQKNARRSTKRNIQLEAKSVETWIDSLPSGVDRVVVDPPRDGLTAKIRLGLVDRPADRLTYVSCNAATLARDLGVLLTAYDIQSVALFDLFPQTGHMEIVAQFKRK